MRARFDGTLILTVEALLAIQQNPLLPGFSGTSASEEARAICIQTFFITE